MNWHQYPFAPFACSDEHPRTTENAVPSAAAMFDSDLQAFLGSAVSQPSHTPSDHAAVASYTVAYGTAPGISAACGVAVPPVRRISDTGPRLNGEEPPKRRLSAHSDRVVIESPRQGLLFSGNSTSGSHPDETSTAAPARKLTLQEKNRQAQARRRMRVKAEQQALEERIQELRSEIQTARLRAARSRAAKTAASNRSESAAAALRSLDESTASRTHPRAHGCPRRHALFQARPVEQRPLATFAAAEAISVAGLASHACLTDNPHPSGANMSLHTSLSNSDQLMSSPAENTQPRHLNWSIRSYKQSVAATQRRPAGEISWFVQLSFDAAAGLPLSFSSHLGSVACVVSMKLMFLLDHLEAAFLTAEQEVLKDCLSSKSSQGAAGQHSPWDTSGSYSGHGGCESSAAGGHAFVPEEPPPFPTAQQSFVPGDAPGTNVSCGVNGVLPAAAAVNFMLHRLLARYHATLPLATWVDLCNKFCTLLERVQMRSGHISQTNKRRRESEAPVTVATCANPNSDNSSAANNGSGATMAGQQPTMADYLSGVGSAVQHASAVVTNVVRQTQYQPKASNATPCSTSSAEARLRENERRLTELHQAWALAVIIVFTDARKLVRQLGLGLDYPKHLPFLQAERIVLDVYERLLTTPEQRLELSKLWAGWLEGCQDIMKSRKAAASSLAGLCVIEDIPVSFPQLLSCICERKAPHPLAVPSPRLGGGHSGPPVSDAPSASKNHGRSPNLFHVSNPHNGSGWSGLSGGGVLRSNPVSTRRHVASWMHKLLGVSAEATATAEAVVGRLWASLDDETDMYGYIKAAHVLPVRCMTASQAALMRGRSVEGGAVMFDYLHLVQLAAQQHRESVVLRGVDQPSSLRTVAA